MVECLRSQLSLRGLLAATTAVSLLLWACGGDQDQPTEPEPEPDPVVTQVEVSPDSARLEALEDTVRFTATVRDQNGNEMSGVRFAWSSSDPEFVSVSSSGLGRSKANGEAGIVAATSGHADTARVVVRQAVATVEIRPDSAVLEEIGDTIRFNGDALDQNGHAVADASLTWQSSDRTVATVDQSGLATALDKGSTRISGERDRVSDQATLRVGAPTALLRHSLEAFAGGEQHGGAVDLDIAVGGGKLIFVTNFHFGLYSTIGRELSVSRNASIPWQGVLPRGEGVADPRVIYDRTSGRFFITMISREGSRRECEPGECSSHILLAVSRTSSPNQLPPDGWYVYATDATLDNDSLTTNWADHPRIAATDEVVVIAVNSIPFDPDKLDEVYTKLRIFDKEPLLHGGAASWTDIVRFESPATGSFEHAIQPVENSEDAPVPLLISDAPGCDYLVWGIRDAGTEPHLESALLSSPRTSQTSCRSPPDAAQPDDGPPLATGASKTLVSAPVYRDGSVWVAQQVQAETETGGVGAIRWSELDVGSWPGAAHIVQDTLFFSDVHHRFFPAVSPDRAGNLIMVYGQSSTRQYPSVYYTFRRVSDPTNRLREPTLAREGESAFTVLSSGTGYYQVARWGDYFDAVLDPQDGSFWIVGQFAKSSDAWGTWIGNVVF